MRLTRIPSIQPYGLWTIPKWAHFFHNKARNRKITPKPICNPLIGTSKSIDVHWNPSTAHKKTPDKRDKHIGEQHLQKLWDDFNRRPRLKISECPSLRPCFGSFTKALWFLQLHHLRPRLRPSGALDVRGSTWSPLCPFWANLWWPGDPSQWDMLTETPKASTNLPYSFGL